MPPYTASPACEVGTLQTTSNAEDHTEPTSKSHYTVSVHILQVFVLPKTIHPVNTSGSTTVECFQSL